MALSNHAPSRAASGFPIAGVLTAIVGGMLVIHAIRGAYPAALVLTRVDRSRTGPSIAQAYRRATEARRRGGAP